MELARTTLTAAGLQFGALTAGHGDELVLCIHGFPDTSRSFRAQLPALATAGYHVVAPMLRGYEAISRPVDRRYDIGTLADDVAGWLDSLGAREAHVVGHDWGAVIAYAAAARHPERVRSLVALAIPPLQRIPEVFARRPLALAQLRYMLGFQLPGAVRRAAKDELRALDRLWARWSPGWTLPEEEREAVHEVLRRPGALDAALRYYRDLFGLWRPRSRRSFALLRREIRVPTLVLYGDRDGCFAPEVYPPAAARGRFPAGLELSCVAGAGHFLHQERPDEVNDALLGWLERRSRGEVVVSSA